ncbi:hypothetical protein GLOIN_2v1847221 [Rhizophagus irregularis DAOM 181602=DAOM 197198]|nr:hypothetical protein GLOIN_2v1847221 [Rhizophagus irregularis DAOM 181602=DAOM 197198]
MMGGYVYPPIVERDLELLFSGEMCWLGFSFRFLDFWTELMSTAFSLAFTWEFFSHVAIEALNHWDSVSRLGCQRVRLVCFWIDYKEDKFVLGVYIVSLILVTFWFFRHGILEKSALVFLYFRQVWMRKIDKFRKRGEIPTWKNRISNIVNKKISDVDAGFSRLHIGWISQMDRMEMDFWFLGGLDEA